MVPPLTVHCLYHVLAQHIAITWSKTISYHFGICIDVFCNIMCYLEC